MGNPSENASSAEPQQSSAGLCCSLPHISTRFRIKGLRFKVVVIAVVGTAISLVPVTVTVFFGKSEPNRHVLLFLKMLGSSVQGVGIFYFRIDWGLPCKVWDHDSIDKTNANNYSYLVQNIAMNRSSQSRRSKNEHQNQHK